jgi:hypothetical protein
VHAICVGRGIEAGKKRKRHPFQVHNGKGKRDALGFRSDAHSDLRLHVGNHDTIHVQRATDGLVEVHLSFDQVDLVAQFSAFRRNQ